MPRDSLFSAGIGVGVTKTLSSNRAYGSDLLGCMVLLNQFTLDLGPAGSLSGFFVVCGPGELSGVRDLVVDQGDAVLIAYHGSSFSFVNFPEMDVAAVLAHLANQANPHSVTKQQVGLGSVDNTADSAKPISALQQQALNQKAPLNSPAFSGTPTAPTAPENTATTQIATTEFVALAIAALAAGAAHEHQISEVENLAEALDDLQDLINSVSAQVAGGLSRANHTGTQPISSVDGLAAFVDGLETKAPLNNPAFTGSPTAPTPTAGDASGKIATTQFVAAAAALVSQAVDSLAALVAAKAPLNSPAFTGLPTAPTPGVDEDSQRLANTAWVRDFLDQQSVFARLQSPAFSGSPTAPTPSNSDDSTRLATTAFVQDVTASAFSSHRHSPYVVEGLLDELQARLEIPSGIVIGGVLSPNAAGTLFSAPPPSEALVYLGARAWSTDGASERPNSGNWVKLYQSKAILGVEGTLADLAPPANYTPGSKLSSTVSRIIVSTHSFAQQSVSQGNKIYYLKPDSGGNPFWVDHADFAQANQNATVIPAGRLIISERSPSKPFSGGLLQNWVNGLGVEYSWNLEYYTNGTLVGLWMGRGQRVDAITEWVQVFGVTGTPTVAVSNRRVILPEFASDAAALAGGLAIGQLYFNGTAVKSVQMPLLQRTALQGPPLTATGVDALVISGLVFDPAIVNPLARLDTFQTRGRYGTIGAAATSVYWTGSMWVLHSHGKTWTSSENVTIPELVKLWSPSGGGAAGNPTVERLTWGTIGLLGQRCYFDSTIYECITEFPARWVSLLAQG